MLIKSQSQKDFEAESADNVKLMEQELVVETKKSIKIQDQLKNKRQNIVDLIQNEKDTTIEIQTEIDDLNLKIDREKEKYEKELENTADNNKQAKIEKQRLFEEYTKRIESFKEERNLKEEELDKAKLSGFLSLKGKTAEVEDIKIKLDTIKLEKIMQEKELLSNLEKIKLEQESDDNKLQNVQDCVKTELLFLIDENNKDEEDYTKQLNELKEMKEQISLDNIGLKKELEIQMQMQEIMQKEQETQIEEQKKIQKEKQEKYNTFRRELTEKQNLLRNQLDQIKTNYEKKLLNAEENLISAQNEYKKIKEEYKTLKNETTKKRK